MECKGIEKLRRGPNRGNGKGRNRGLINHENKFEEKITERT